MSDACRGRNEAQVGALRVVSKVSLAVLLRFLRLTRILKNEKLLWPFDAGSSSMMGGAYDADTTSAPTHQQVRKEENPDRIRICARSLNFVSNHNLCSSNTEWLSRPLPRHARRPKLALPIRRAIILLLHRSEVWRWCVHGAVIATGTNVAHRCLHRPVVGEVVRDVLDCASAFSRAVAVALGDGDFRCFGHVAVALEDFFGGDVGFFLEDGVIEQRGDIFWDLCIDCQRYRLKSKYERDHSPH